MNETDMKKIHRTTILILLVMSNILQPHVQKSLHRSPDTDHTLVRIIIVVCDTVQLNKRLVECQSTTLLSKFV